MACERGQSNGTTRPTREDLARLIKCGRDCEPGALPPPEASPRTSALAAPATAPVENQIWSSYRRRHTTGALIKGRGVSFLTSTGGLVRNRALFKSAPARLDETLAISSDCNINSSGIIIQQQFAPVGHKAAVKALQESGACLPAIIGDKAIRSHSEPFSGASKSLNKATAPHPRRPNSANDDRQARHCAVGEKASLPGAKCCALRLFSAPFSSSADSVAFTDIYLRGDSKASPTQYIQSNYARAGEIETGGRTGERNLLKGERRPRVSMETLAAKYRDDFRTRKELRFYNAENMLYALRTGTIRV
mmetsp:Transcript_45473/g.115022  ORF Transcript_45473/g.115022 Transcript_45473/m.115022 type:complete len:306 (-) Transcript_45473:287-1204(-)